MSEGGNSTSHDTEAASSQGLTYLAEHQDHWLERIVLPWLAVAFTSGVLTLLRQFILLFFGGVSVPWWVLLLGGLAALESVYLTPLQIKARAPVTTRILELGVFLVLTYVLLYWDSGGGLPLFPFSVLKQPEVYVPLGLVAFGWVQGGGFGRQLLTLGTLKDVQVDHTGHNLTWEQEAMLSQHSADRGRASAASELARKLLFYCAAFAFTAAIATEVVGASSEWQRLTIWPLGIVLAAGLALQGGVYLYRMRTIWREAQVQVEPRIDVSWMAGLAVAAGGAALIGILLPGNLSPLRFAQVMEVIGKLLGPLLDMDTAPERQPPSVQAPEATQGPPPLLQDPEAAAGLVQILLLLAALVLIGGLVLLVVGAVLALFARSELERLPAMLRLPLLVYLYVKRTLLQILRWGRAAVGGAKRSLRSWQAAPRADDEEGSSRWEETQPPSAFTLYVRHLFVALVRLATQNGAPLRPGQTPTEYGRQLEQKFSNTAVPIRFLVQVYGEVRYSRRTIRESLRTNLDTAWAEIKKSITRDEDHSESKERNNGRNLKT